MENFASLLAKFRCPLVGVAFPLPADQWIKPNPWLDIHLASEDLVGVYHVPPLPPSLESGQAKPLQPLRIGQVPHPLHLLGKPVLYLL